MFVYKLSLPPRKEMPFAFHHFPSFRPNLLPRVLHSEALSHVLYGLDAHFICSCAGIHQQIKDGPRRTPFSSESHIKQCLN